MVHTSDIPARSGVGSSSAFTVGFLNALYALTGKMVSKRQLAREAIHIEQNVLKENVGSQDQAAVAFGGLNMIEFGGDKDFYVTPMTITSEKTKLLKDHLMLFYTGISRTANDIAGEQIKKTREISDELSTIKQIARKAFDVLNSESGDISEFGRLLHESWEIKRSLTDRISNENIDEMYQAARSAGAIGGKLLGAGGGGFMLIFAEPGSQQKIKETLKDRLFVPFEFENMGSQVVLYSTQDFY
jgi:D-glycero-alpha-D-manno-heptose-7-phosphate kinase